MLLDLFNHWAVYSNVAPLGTLEALNFSLSHLWSSIQLAFVRLLGESAWLLGTLLPGIASPLPSSQPLDLLGTEVLTCS